MRSTSDPLYGVVNFNPDPHLWYRMPAGSHNELVYGKTLGYRIEDLAERRAEGPLKERVRCMDKLTDELTQGRAIEKILRQ